MENSTGASPAFCTLCAKNCSVNSLECGRGYKFFAEMANEVSTGEPKEAEINGENLSFTEHEGRGFRRGRGGRRGHEARGEREGRGRRDGHDDHAGRRHGRRHHESFEGDCGYSHDRDCCSDYGRSHDRGHGHSDKHDCSHSYDHDHIHNHGYDHDRDHDRGDKRGRRHGRRFGCGDARRSGRVGDPTRFCGSTQDEKLVFLVAECAHAFRHGGAALRGRDLVLEALGSHGGTMSQRDLLDLAGTRPASLSELLSRMETEGLLFRTPDDRDRRGMVVELTEAGAEAARIAGVPHRNSAADALSALSDEEKSHLEQLLAKVAASIGR